ncbi:MAG TPA: hypothetical protein VGL81_05725 [Polyangiaceae bacterium]
MSSPAGAQTSPPPNRDQGWGTATAVTVGAAGAVELLMPRIFYSDPESTVGWKARWHVSQLAPVMTLTVLTLANEYALKGAIKSFRPGCDATNTPGPNCETYGSPSSHAFGAFSALGNGAAVWLFDMTKWSGGRFNIGSFIGNVFVPAVLAGVTDVGRGAGNFESGGQIVAGSVAGVGFGFLVGMTYALMARPECGYTGSMICW